MLSVVMLSGPWEVQGVDTGYMSSTQAQGIHRVTLDWMHPKYRSLPHPVPVIGWAEADRKSSRESHPRVEDFEENHAGEGAYLSPGQKTRFWTCLHD